MTKRNQSILPRVINIIGVDGSGKTSVANHLAEKLKRYGYDAEVVWLRYNHIFSKPLLGFCRMFGLTTYQNIEGHRIGYHNFHRSSIVSYLFVILQLLDSFLARLIRISPLLKKENKVIIIDRYVFDILIDISIDTQFESLYYSKIGNLFKKLLPKESIVFYIDRELEQLRQARPENIYDKNFARRVNHYRNIADDKDIIVLTNDGSLEDLFKEVELNLGINL